jgi:hypothetical protein
VGEDTTQPSKRTMITNGYGVRTTPQMCAASNLADEVTRYLRPLTIGSSTFTQVSESH